MPLWHGICCIRTKTLFRQISVICGGAASSDSDHSAVLVVNPTEEECSVELALTAQPGEMRCLMLDETHDLNEIPFDGKQIILPAFALCVVTNR